jgi:hypothetical protein
MWKVLQIVNGGKATNLGAEAYIKRVRHIEKKKNKESGVKGVMMKGMSKVVNAMGSMG